MAIDLYVMPLWKFKVGDFKSPIEAAIGIKPRRIYGSEFEETVPSPGWLDRWKARRGVAAIRKAVEKAHGAQCHWRDDGDVVYSSQTRGMESLRAYAHWLDCRDRLPEFCLPPNNNYFEHPVMSLEVERPSCPHLVGHSCFNGYFLPCEFERLVQAEPYVMYGHWPASRSVGSTPRLIRELDFVQEHLQVDDGYEYPEDDPLVAVKAAYLQLRQAADLSHRHGLPIIFWG